MIKKNLLLIIMIVSINPFFSVDANNTEVHENYNPLRKYQSKNQPRWVSEVLHVLHTVIDAVVPSYHAESIADVVKVRYTSTDALCEQECQFINDRLAMVQKALNKLDIETTTQSCPRIAWCFSGGGFRAMTTTLFALKAAQEEGLLDASLYLAGLSGSTWALAPWISSGTHLNHYINTLGTKTENGLHLALTAEEFERISDYFIYKMEAGEGFSSIDIYGTLLANTLLQSFGKDRFFVTLKQAHKTLEPSSYPFPIYTASTPDANPYEWFEITPYEIGSSYTQMYIPIDAYGRHFSQGKSTKNAPELSLCYLMGVFGSAYDADVRDLITNYSNSIFPSLDHLPKIIEKPITNMLHDIMVNHEINEVRIAPSNERNFSYQFSSNPLHDKEHLILMDGGLACNLPFPPLLRPSRAVDVIIVYDASADNSNFDTLRETEEYAARKNLPFPPIDYTNLDRATVRVFKDAHDTSCPVVIYFPMIKNDAYSTTFDPNDCESNSFCNTFNFKYTQEDINTLGGLAYFSVKEHADLIKQTIKDVVSSKNK